MKDRIVISMIDEAGVKGCSDEQSVVAKPSESSETGEKRRSFKERYFTAQEATLRAQARDERPPTGLEDLEVD